MWETCQLTKLSEYWTAVVVPLQVAGVDTNIDFLRRLASHDSFADSDVHTGFIPVCDI